MRVNVWRGAHIHTLAGYKHIYTSTYTYALEKKASRLDTAHTWRGGRENVEIIRHRYQKQRHYREVLGQRG
jgi:hypothetical protein